MMMCFEVIKDWFRFHHSSDQLVRSTANQPAPPQTWALSTGACEVASDGGARWALQEASLQKLT